MLDKIKRRTFFKFSFYQVLTFVFFSLILGGMFLAHVIWAADPVNVQYQVPFGGLSSGDLLPEYINKIYKWMIGAGLVLVGIMVTVGGFMYVSSAGDAKTVASGKKYIVNSLIGMLLLVSSYLILNTINPDVTTMEVLEVSTIEQKTMPTGICACDSNSDCPQANTYCMSSSDTTPFNPKVSSDVAEALSSVFNIFMGVATLPMGVGTTIGPKIVAQGGVGAAAKSAATRFATAAAKKTADLVVRAATKVKDKFVWAFKNPGKFAGKAVAKTVSTGVKVWAAKEVILFVGLIIIANMGFTFEFSASCPNPEGKSLCVSDIFKYNLIPHGMAPSNEPGIGIKVNIDDGTMEPADPPRTFLYNSDGTLPLRREMLGDVTGTYAVHYFVPPLGNVEPAYLFFGGKVFPGLTNRDACMPSNNHCPCLEWEIWDKEAGNYKCKRQARCVAGNAIHPRLDDDYSFCLTGSQGEPCENDNDCRVGNQCVVIPNSAVSSLSLFRKGIDGATSTVQGLTKDLKTATGGIYELKSPFAMQQVCMPTSGGGASRVIDSECTIADNSAYCKPGTGITDRNVPCVPMKAAAVSEQDPSKMVGCGMLNYICYQEIDGAPKYAVASLETRKKILRFPYVYKAQSEKDCFVRYSKSSGIADKIINLMNGDVSYNQIVLYVDGGSGSDFEQKKYENVLGYINRWKLPISRKQQFIDDYFKSTSIKEAQQAWKDDIKNKVNIMLSNEKNYLLQQNGQCYINLTDAYSTSLPGEMIRYSDLSTVYLDNKVTSFVNLSLLEGDIGTWFDERVVSENLKCDIGLVPIRDLLWVKIIQSEVR
ncbi:MAG TPA: pilin [bacterium]|nr:pilin [bacterium]